MSQKSIDEKKIIVDPHQNYTAEDGKNSKDSQNSVEYFTYGDEPLDQNDQKVVEKISEVQPKPSEQKLSEEIEDKEQNEFLIPEPVCTLLPEGMLAS